MNYVPNLSYHISRLCSSLSPRGIWHYYVQYLWYYQPNSWVARIASVCRVLAILISFPLVVLALLVRYCLLCFLNAIQFDFVA